MVGHGRMSRRLEMEQKVEIGWLEPNSTGCNILVCLSVWALPFATLPLLPIHRRQCLRPTRLRLYRYTKGNSIYWAWANKRDRGHWPIAAAA